MVVTFVTAAIAVIGTLLGSIVSGRFQERAAERTVRVSHDHPIRRERLDAVRDVATTISAHRAAMWKRGDAVLKGESAERIQELSDRSHATRAAVTGPLTALRVLIEDEEVRAAADRMVTLTYSIRDTYRLGQFTEAEARAAKDALTAARAAAVLAHDEFVNVAGRYLRAV